MKSKRPAFQFYPGDWMRDTALRSCSVGARGLWIDMICLMHEGEEYGHLIVGSKVILPPTLARMVGATLRDVEGWLEELSEAGVYSVRDDGCIYSRRMIRDEKIRESRAAGGIKGGNPKLIGASKVNLTANLSATKGETFGVTPSSSSSSSSSSSKKKKTYTLADARLCLSELGVEKQHIDDWLSIRATKKLPLTQTAIQHVLKEAEASGMTMGEAVKRCCVEGWAGFKASWVLNASGGRDNPAPQQSGYSAADQIAETRRRMAEL